MLNKPNRNYKVMEEVDQLREANGTLSRTQVLWNHLKDLSDRHHCHSHRKQTGYGRS